MISLSDLEIQELEGQILKKKQMKALLCFRQLRLQKLQNTREKNEYTINSNSFDFLGATTDYREFLTQNCGTSI